MARGKKRTSEKTLLAGSSQESYGSDASINSTNTPTGSSSTYTSPHDELLSEVTSVTQEKFAPADYTQSYEGQVDLTASLLHSHDPNDEIEKHHNDRVGINSMNSTSSTSTDTVSIPVQNIAYAEVTTFMFLLFWILGLVNNFGYVVVFSSVKSITEHFDVKSLAGVIQWANVGLGVGAKLINMTCLLEISFGTRMFFNFLFMLIGGGLTMISMKLEFAIAVVGVIFIGISSAFGESVLLGYFKRYDPKVAGAWSSGTGGAGLFGSLAYVLLKSVYKLDNFTVFSILIPLALVYYIAFLALYLKYDPVSGSNTSALEAEAEKTRLLQEQADEKRREEEYYKNPHNMRNIQQNATYGSEVGVTSPSKYQLFQSQIEEKLAISDDQMSDDENYEKNIGFSSPNLGGMDILPSAPSTPIHTSMPGSTIFPPALSTTTSSAPTSVVPADTPTYVTDENDTNKDVIAGDINDYEYRITLPICTRIRLIMPVIFSTAFQLYLVYFFEYCAYVTFALKANPDSQDSEDFLLKNAYEVLSFCYQLGVLISRSSIQFIQIERIYLLTIGQGLNFCIWFAQAHFHFMPLYVQFAHMVCIGLFAGLMYVNVFHSLLKNQNLSPDRELGVNIVSIFVTFGVISSSLFSLLALNTFLKD